MVETNNTSHTSGVRDIRVAIDLRPLARESGVRGIGTYIRRTVRALEQWGRHTYIGLLFPSQEIPNEFNIPFERVPGPEQGITLMDQFFLRRLLKRNGWVYHTFEYAPPYRYPAVITLHDFIPYNPEKWAALSFRHRIVYRLKDFLVKRVSCIAVNSRLTLEEAQNRYPHLRERIFLVPPPLFPFDPPCPYEKTNDERTKNCILLVGPVEKRKGFSYLIPFFQKYASVLVDHEFHFHITGAVIDMNFQKAWVESLPESLRNYVHLHGFVPIEKLYELYHTCEKMLFLSDEEGLGLPVLEGLAHGIEVISLALPSLKSLDIQPTHVLKDRSPESIFEHVFACSCSRSQHTDITRLEIFHAQWVAQQLDHIYETLTQESEAFFRKRPGT